MKLIKNMAKTLKKKPVKKSAKKVEVEALVSTV
jgi:hypothetical protein